MHRLFIFQQHICITGTFCFIIGACFILHIPAVAFFVPCCCIIFTYCCTTGTCCCILCSLLLHNFYPLLHYWYLMLHYHQERSCCRLLRLCCPPLLRCYLRLPCCCLLQLLLRWPAHPPTNRELKCLSFTMWNSALLVNSCHQYDWISSLNTVYITSRQQIVLYQIYSTVLSYFFMANILSQNNWLDWITEL